MSWNRIIISFIAILIVEIGTLQARELMALSEDELIMRGLWYEEYRAFDRSREIYGKLYDNTGAGVYLFKEISAALRSQTDIKESIERLKLWESKHHETLDVKRLLISLYLTAREIDLAKSEAKSLIELSDEPRDLELASNPFLYNGEFKRALELLTKVYEKTSNEDILLRIVTILDEYTHEEQRAIQLLETHRRMNASSNAIYLKLISLYVKMNNIDGVLDTYKALYAKDNKEMYLRKIINVYAYKKDIDGAIRFLEKEDVGDDILYELYKEKKVFDKALSLVDRLYQEDKSVRWIAEKAILTFESANDKEDREMISKVISYFKKAVLLGMDDSLYLNYYGYLLIDKEIDVKKGIKIVKDALKQQPDNRYYLDSLAWGYYKEHACKEAYNVMKRVVEKEELEEEIREHWELIQKCK